MTQKDLLVVYDKVYNGDGDYFVDQIFKQHSADRTRVRHLDFKVIFFSNMIYSIYRVFNIAYWCPEPAGPCPESGPRPGKCAINCRPKNFAMLQAGLRVATLDATYIFIFT
jgi:hypothetical protein